MSRKKKLREITLMLDAEGKVTQDPQKAVTVITQIVDEQNRLIKETVYEKSS